MDVLFEPLLNIDGSRATHTGGRDGLLVASVDDVACCKHAESNSSQMASVPITVIGFPLLPGAGINPMASEVLCIISVAGCSFIVPILLALTMPHL